MKFLIASLMGALLVAPAMAQTNAQSSTASPGSEAAPSQPGSVNAGAWGVLAKLAGNRWQTADGVVRAFEWSIDGRELVESELVGGSPAPTHIYSLQGTELVQHDCLPDHSPCIRLRQRFGAVVDDGAIVFKEISAMAKGNDPSVPLRERPVADWGKWKRKYLFISETLIRFQLVGTDRFEVTRSFTSKMTSRSVDEPWENPRVEPVIAYQRAGTTAAMTTQVAAADFGPMESFVGKRMISEDLGEILELQHQRDGSLVIQWFSLSGQAIGRYAFAAETGGGGKLELHDYPYVNSQDLKMKTKVVMWQQGGVLLFLTQPDGSGHTMTHEFSLANGKIRTARSDSDTGSTFTGKPKLESFSSGARTFIPATPELIAEAVAAHERRMEEARRQAQLAADERRERAAQANRNFASFAGALNMFADTYNESMAEYQAQQMQQQADGAELRRRAQQDDVSPADARRDTEVVRQANQRQDEEAARLAELRRQYERQRAAAAQAAQPASRPSAAGATADARRASTDTDANRCVTQTEVRQDDTFKGNTAAYVVNGCGTPVEVRICLKAESGWKCGASTLSPQASWSYSTFHATGPVFVDAKISGSSRRFADPQ